MNEKLIRDGIPAIMTARGDSFHYRKALPRERIDLLKAKLLEEAQEVNECLCIEELADVMEVVYALLDTLHHIPSHLEAVRTGKNIARGAFDKCLVLNMESHERA